jgi:hypothetical protein
MDELWMVMTGPLRGMPECSFEQGDQGAYLDPTIRETCELAYAHSTPIRRP